MNNITAEKILDNLARVWTDCDQVLLEKCYDKNFTADYYGIDVTYADLINRIDYMRANQTDRKITVLDCVAEPKKIAARMKYSAIDKTEGIIDSNILVIYHFNDNDKVTRAWASNNQKVDYLKK